MAAPAFHQLRVAAVSPLTDEAVAVELEVPPDLAGEFRYLPGQHVTLRAVLDGEDLRRSYSICANASDGKLRVGIKRLPGGAFSTWATTTLAAGDMLEVMEPVGEFVIRPDETKPKRRVAIAAGSGITPVLSLVATTLEAEPESTWAVLFGNRESRTVMFLEELEGLKDRYPTRLQLVHVLSREETVVPLFSGRLDRPKLEELLERLVDPISVDEWYLCGPFEMVEAARATLIDTGVRPDAIKDELFFAGPLDPSTLPLEPVDGEASVELLFSLDGRLSSTRMRPNGPILDAALTVRPELPFSCRGGMCASCKARLVEGEVEMKRNWALADRDLAAGYVLTCQALPLTDVVQVDYDV
jgi:ring-1,2-phenylacetyl-CoA epoxidase subunit PaaE